MEETLMKRFISVLLALFVFLLITTSNVSAADNTTMAMVGITRGQIVRISLFHPNDVAGIVCPSIVDIVDVNGKVLAETTVNIAAGKGAFVDFDLAKALTGIQRVQFHAVVRTSADHPGFGNGEVIDKLTGKTQFTFPPEIILDKTLMPIVP
jgi:uncharacterized membrane protein